MGVGDHVVDGQELHATAAVVSPPRPPAATATATRTDTAHE